MYGNNWDSFRSRYQKVFEKLCLLCDKIVDNKTKATLALITSKSGDISSIVCSQLVSASQELRQMKEIDSTLMDEIFNALSDMKDALEKQEMPRLALIISINDELLEHAKYTVTS